MHQTIKKVGEDIENFRFNTAISALMILFNKMEKSGFSKSETETFLKLLAPLAPHFAEELWNQLKNKKSIHTEPWPEYNRKFIGSEEYDLVIQINGKMRDKVKISKNLERLEIEKLVFKRESVKKYTKAKEIKKIIFIEGRLINIVI